MKFYTARFQNIEQEVYELEVLTPMFLCGANPNKPELRISSIKGMLRFWWRALHPDLINNNYDNLRKQESILFGDAGDTYGKSRVKLHIEKDSNVKTKSFNPLPHKNVQFQFNGFDVGQKFNIAVCAPEEIHKLFEFAIVVCGIGKRSRRGFGSLSINKKGDGDVNNPDNNDLLIDNLLNLIKMINKNNIYKKTNGDIEVSQIYKNSEYPYVEKIQISKNSPAKYDRILKIIGQSSHKNNSDYTGFTRNKKRLSSPIYVSVVKRDSKCIPIISTLHTAFNTKDSGSHGIDTSGLFMKPILNDKEEKLNDMEKTR